MMKKNTLQKYWPLYLMTLGIMMLFRYFSKTTDSDVILWILTPTVRWAGILSGLSFEYLPHKGYLNCFYRFLVAPSCAGIRFLMIAFLMLSFSFLHRIEKRKKGWLWFGFSLVFSYIATIWVNSLRIIVSIYLPPALEKPGVKTVFLTSERLHTLIGTGVYFSSLCLLYLFAAAVCRRFFSDTDGNAPLPVSPSLPRRPFHSFIPAFWYLLTVLVLPFCKRILTNDWEDFGPYALLVLCTCFAVSALLYALSRLRRCKNMPGGPP